MEENNMKNENKQLRKSFHWDAMLNGIFYRILIAGFTTLAFLETHSPASAMMWGLLMANLFALGALFMTITQTLEYKNKYE